MSCLKLSECVISPRHCKTQRKTEMERFSWATEWPLIHSNQGGKLKDKRAPSRLDFYSTNPLSHSHFPLPSHTHTHGCPSHTHTCTLRTTGFLWSWQQLKVDGRIRQNDFGPYCDRWLEAVSTLRGSLPLRCGVGLGGEAGKGWAHVRGCGSWCHYLLWLFFGRAASIWTGSKITKTWKHFNFTLSQSLLVFLIRFLQFTQHINTRCVPVLFFLALRTK